MWLNVIKAKLNVRQYCWPAVSCRVGVLGVRGFSAGAPCSLQLSVGTNPPNRLVHHKC